ncbi:MAG: response regulator [Deltaproteobacteria bacterium]|nr:response regulator [Deltaproteobacteria bacterium]
METRETENPRALVVDDEDVFRNLLARTLRLEGYDVDTAPDGWEAMKLIGEHAYELVLTDLMMPRAGGLDVLKAAVRRDPHVAVVLITGYASLDSGARSDQGRRVRLHHQAFPTRRDQAHCRERAGKTPAGDGEHAAGSGTRKRPAAHRRVDLVAGRDEKETRRHRRGTRPPAARNLRRGPVVAPPDVVAGGGRRRASGADA